MIITGTRRGIGKSIAEFYIEQGNNVIGCSRGEGTSRKGDNKTRIRS